MKLLTNFFLWGWLLGHVIHGQEPDPGQDAVTPLQRLERLEADPTRRRLSTAYCGSEHDEVRTLCGGFFERGMCNLTVGCNWHDSRRRLIHKDNGCCGLPNKPDSVHTKCQELLTQESCRTYQDQCLWKGSGRRLLKFDGSCNPSENADQSSDVKTQCTKVTGMMACLSYPECSWDWNHSWGGGADPPAQTWDKPIHWQQPDHFPWMDTPDMETKKMTRLPPIRRRLASCTGCCGRPGKDKDVRAACQAVDTQTTCRNAYDAECIWQTRRRLLPFGSCNPAEGVTGDVAETCNNVEGFQACMSYPECNWDFAFEWGDNDAVPINQPKPWNKKDSRGRRLIPFGSCTANDEHHEISADMRSACESVDGLMSCMSYDECKWDFSHSWEGNPLQGVVNPGDPTGGSVPSGPNGGIHNGGWQAPDPSTFPWNQPVDLNGNGN